MSGSTDDGSSPGDSRALAPAARPNARFATTCWSMVVHAGRGEDSDARDALARLCHAYWFPIYA